jgi:hypothetical protein
VHKNYQILAHLKDGGKILRVNWGGGEGVKNKSKKCFLKKLSFPFFRVINLAQHAPNSGLFHAFLPVDQLPAEIFTNATSISVSQGSEVGRRRKRNPIAVAVIVVRVALRLYKIYKTANVSVEFVFRNSKGH